MKPFQICKYEGLEVKDTPKLKFLLLSVVSGGL